MVRAEVNKSARTIQSSCINLERVQRGTESNTSAVLERERSSREKVQFSKSNIKFSASCFLLVSSDYVASREVFEFLHTC